MKYGRGNLAKVLTVIIYSMLFVLLVMLAKVFYFHKKGVSLGPPPIIIDEQTTEPAKLQPLKDDIFARILMTETQQKLEHFHNLDDTVKVTEHVPNVCLVCHGSLPHSKNKDTRALYNMHTYFCACEVCHVKDKDIFFTWFDNKTGLTIDKISDRVEEDMPEGTYSGNYDAKIVPCVTEGISLVRLDNPVTEDEVDKYLKIQAQYNYDQRSQAVRKLHRHLTKEPVKCTDCHQKENPYLDFKRLGYPKHLCDEFTGTEVAKMVEKYKSLKLPTMFRPDEIIENKKAKGQQNERRPILNF